MNANNEPRNNEESNTQRPFSRRDFIRLASAASVVGATGLTASNALAAPPKTKLDPPSISCLTTPDEGETPTTQASIAIEVCAGDSGAPAGFSIQWMTAADYEANGNAWYASDDSRLCKASFSGNAKDSRYLLAAEDCVVVNIGELLFDNGTSTNCAGALLCGTNYVFRAFAHATSKLMRSDFTANLTCSTLDCDHEDACTYTQGYWKTHGAAGPASEKIFDADGNLIGYVSEWPVAGLTLGTVTYTEAELQSIFDKPAAGNGLITLAHQLIAAKLNVADGADPTDVAAAITAADALIGALVVPPVGSGSLAPNATSALVATLASYNEGETGPGHCG